MSGRKFLNCEWNAVVRSGDMRKWTHDELHILMDGNSILKEKSDHVHASSQETFDERECGKLHMMEIYAEAVGCKQVDMAKKFVKEVFSCMRSKRALDGLRNQYTLQKLCHSSIGNDYLCFCDE